MNGVCTKKRGDRECSTLYVEIQERISRCFYPETNFLKKDDVQRIQRSNDDIRNCHYETLQRGRTEFLSFLLNISIANVTKAQGNCIFDVNKVSRFLNSYRDIRIFTVRIFIVTSLYELYRYTGQGSKELLQHTFQRESGDKLRMSESAM